MVFLAQAVSGEGPEFEDAAAMRDVREAEALLMELASVFSASADESSSRFDIGGHTPETNDSNVEAKYRALLEQIPAVVFMAYVDRGTSEAYVSPEIEGALGYSREEWLEDPVRWYDRIHPDDKQRWSLEAAEMFLDLWQAALRSSYRMIARDGRVVWFHCDARMVRRSDGQPWFIHGVAFDYISSGPEGHGTGTAAGAEFCVGDSRHRGRAGYGSGPGRPHRAIQPSL